MCIKEKSEHLQMTLVPIFAISTDFESTKNLLGFPFQAPVFFGQFIVISDFIKMNQTLWNSTEEAVSSLIFGGFIIYTYAYAIFLCYAIYDYQVV